MTKIKSYKLLAIIGGLILYILHVLKKKKTKAVQSINLICDTTFYFNPEKTIINDSTINIIGTKWNGWELITSRRFNQRDFKLLQRAARNFLNIPHAYIHETPMAYSLPYYRVQSDLISKESFERIRIILTDLASSETYESFQRTEAYIAFRDHDTPARRDMEQFMRDIIQKAKIIDPNADMALLHDIFLANYTEFISDWYKKQFNVTIDKNHVLLKADSVFTQVLLAYLLELFKGAIQVGINDFNDLMHLLYIDNDHCFHTKEKKWISYIQNSDSGKNRVIH